MKSRSSKGKGNHQRMVWPNWWKIFINNTVWWWIGGVNIHLGENFYSNWNLAMLDVCPITIGDNAMIGPNCQFLTPLHPLDPDERNSV